jgi:hypothetical protein
VLFQYIRRLLYKMAEEEKVNLEEIEEELRKRAKELEEALK